MGHTPVLLDAVLARLDPPPAAAILDGTVGAGGHAAALLRRAGPEARLLGLDRDPEAIAWAATTLAFAGSAAVLRLASFAAAPEVAEREGFRRFETVLLDLGANSMQLDTAERGFSFLRDGPLDMRLGPDALETAAALLARLSETELDGLLAAVAAPRSARRVARAIVRARRLAPIRTTRELAAIVLEALRGVPGRPRRHGRAPLHPATATFLALRLAVNREIEHLERALPRLFDLLVPGGRLAVISFHSLEDRSTKRFFRERERAGTAIVLTRRVIEPDEGEIRLNPRARSARLRVLERTCPDSRAGAAPVE